jgi:cytochrome c biogenesis protein
MRSVFRFFSSVKLAVTLIIIIVLVSILGTLIPQQCSAQEYAARYGQLSGLLEKLQFTHLYGSAWYLALLGLFALNVLICTLTRLRAKLRRAFRPQVESDSKALQATQAHAQFKRKGNAAEAAAAIRGMLCAHHYRIREHSAPGRIHLLGRKRVLGWFGSDVVHLGLLTILAGGILSGLGGYRAFLSLKEGKSQAVPRAKFAVRLDRFETEYYPNGAVRDWRSYLTVLEDGRDVLKKSIEVNHPLAYKGILFYQSGYDTDSESPEVELWVRKQSDPSYLRQVVLQPGQEKPLEAGGPRLALLRFLPDFVIDENRHILTRSAQLNNPAAQVELSQGPKKLLSAWVFANYPEFAMMHQGERSDFRVEFKSVHPNLSKIEAARDPGATVIWIGCGLLMTGLFLAFYWPTRQVRILLIEAQGNTEVLAAAVSDKNQEALDSEFDRLIKAVRS